MYRERAPIWWNSKQLPNREALKKVSPSKTGHYYKHGILDLKNLTLT